MIIGSAVLDRLLRRGQPLAHWSAWLSACWARRASPAARAFSAWASNWATRSRNWATRASASGSVRRHWRSAASRTLSSTARRRASSGRISSRGTLPISSHRSWMERRAARAAVGSEVSIFSASVRRAFLASALAANSASRSANVPDRRAKKASWAVRKRCHSASSASFCARPVAFHSAIRSRKRAAVGPQSSESDSASASSVSSSLRAWPPHAGGRGRRSGSRGAG
ncbi:hypothetical protein BJF90_37780 [Pseudonocardia sp. CNS-004]|nr:hypothetical protein BJF90_37780 [Pseudonocardia sp. CNS-004]